ncbi:replicative DNA helicase [Dechloromonas denitrificans]|uniref:replicative DNA helicase n=1 Tax=Dechloromonas denitrificans TaxID=281362 RepID=UPI0009FA6110|nr:replicative DNA helicase [Dechloromonas denitrificans]
MSSPLFHIESEQSVLGGLLIDPKAFDHVDRLQESDFYREDHRLIFRHIVMMLAERQPVDVVTVAESLVSAGVDEDSTGLAYLGELAANTPSATNIRRYAAVVSEKRALRDLLAASAQIADIANAEGSKPADQRIDEAQAVVFALAERRIEGSEDPETIGALLPSVIEDIQARYDRGGAITGLSTGFTDLDAKTCGLNPGDLVIVAGRPSMGKTAFALNVAEHVAVNEDKPALVFSMEMGKKQLSERSIASIGRVSMNALRSGQMSDDEWTRMSFALGKLFNAPLLIEDAPALTVTQMRSRARRAAKKNGLSLIVVDYIQLASGDSASMKNGSREQEVSSVSRGLKALAKEFNCPVIALSQLNRKVDDRPNKRPLMSDLRDSGAIEQDADLILMMYRDEYYNPDTPDKGIAEIIVAKQRMGETGIIPVLFRGEFSRFENLTSEAKRELFEARRLAKPMARGTRGFD